MDLYIDTIKIFFIVGISFGLGLYVAYRIADFIEAMLGKIKHPIERKN